MPVGRGGSFPQSRPAFNPTEYNTYGAGSSLDIAYKTDETGTWRKNFNIHDHLGNVRAIIRLRDTAEILAQYDYAPFGDVLWSSGTDNRLGFIGKEKDNESSLGDFGVRKYDDGIGRFCQVEPLWESFPGLSPYVYSANNPISFLDKDGMAIQAVTEEQQQIVKGMVDENDRQFISFNEEGFVELSKHVAPFSSKIVGEELDSFTALQYLV
ncbi:MAG: RHS repeat-associated core domain-containing protein, partial [Candidatus Kapabacteria bacterium]|nr:RHS repeat-associated core domain-containing protein [Candidatus Kapabacteria bacterium]